MAAAAARSNIFGLTFNRNIIPITKFVCYLYMFLNLKILSGLRNVRSYTISYAYRSDSSGNSRYIHAYYTEIRMK